jgi:hypothetical protein
MNPTLRRVVQQTYQRSAKAIANNESGMARNWKCGGVDLSGMVKGGVTEPMTWQRLKELTQQMASGGVASTGEAIEPG